jgi:hypothetical protein
MRHARGASVVSESEDDLRERILASSSHRRADRDLDLLARPELRPLRLQLELLKPELTLADLGVHYTLVVFGSARILPPEVAEAALAQARSRGAPAAECKAAERALERSRYYTIARELGRIVGRACVGPEDRRLVLTTGGGPGLMEAANRGAFDVGSATMGLGIVLPREQQPNPYITPELSFQLRYFALRKMHFMLRARGLIAFPGGYGTFDELFETLCLVQTGKRTPIPVVLVGREFWSRAVDFQLLVDEGMIDPSDLELFSIADTAEDVWQQVTGWYAARGRSIVD